MKKLLLIIANILIIPPVAMYSYYTFSPAKEAQDNPPTITTHSSPRVLGATDDQEQIYFTVNIPATFKQDISAPNIVYSVNGKSGEIVIDNSLVAGDGIGVEGRTISNTGILTLVAGDGISVEGNTITNSGIKSLSAGTGISIDGSTITNTYSFTPDYTQSGWTDNGSSVVLTTITDSVTMANVILNNLTVTNGNSIKPDTDLGSDLGSSSLRFNNLWVANINSNSSQAFSGQTTFSYPPTDTTISEASVIINPTTSVASGQLLGLAIAGYQKALIDEDGDIILGYSDATSAPASDYPLNIYGHSGTRVAFVDTSGKGRFGSQSGLNTSIGANGIEFNWAGGQANYGSIQFHGGGADISSAGNPMKFINGGSTHMTLLSSGNVGIGTTSPGAKLDVEGNIVLGDSTTGDIDGFLYFADDGDKTSHYLQWNDGAGRFDISHVLYTGESMSALGGYQAGSFTFLQNGLLKTSNSTALTIDPNSAGAQTLNLGVSGDGDIIAIHGNVGIGTTSPSEKLEISGNILATDGSNSAIQIHSDIGNTPKILFGTDADIDNYMRIVGSSSGTNRIEIRDSNFKITGDNTANILFIEESSGNVGIGTTSPNYQLHIDNSSTGDANMLKLSVAGGGFSRLLVSVEDGGGSDYRTQIRPGHSGVKLSLGGGDRIDDLIIDTSGNVDLTTLGTGTVYSNSGVLTNTDPSDENLKNNILTLEDGTLDKLNGLRPVSFQWKSTGDGALGFIAQEVNEVFPELVGSNSDGTLGLYTTQFIPVLVKAIQEQQLQIDEISLSTASADLSTYATLADTSSLLDLINELKTQLASTTTSITGYFEKLFVGEVHQKTLCIGEASDDETCLNQDQLKQLLETLPSPTPEPSSTPEPSASPTPSLEPSPTPDPTPEASDSGSVTP
jgi:hypothetical protein